MDSINPITPTVAVTLGSLVTSSPCKTCRHWAAGPGPSICIDWPDCPQRIPRQPISCYTSPASRLPPKKPVRKDVVLHRCPFEGCERRTQYEACYKHKRTVDRRREHGITDPSLYQAGEQRGPYRVGGRRGGPS